MSSARSPARQRSQLCADPDVAKVPDTAIFTTPGGVDMTSNLLAPQPITQDNLNLVVEAGWIDEATLCDGVEAGSVAACPLITTTENCCRQVADCVPPVRSSDGGHVCSKVPLDERARR